MKGRLLDTAPPPGSPEWLSRMSASKIAAVVGLSPYESRFSLWHRMAGLVPQQKQTAVMSRGHYLEPGICKWWADQHPDLETLRGQSYLHETRDWQVAAPDRLVVRKDDAGVTSLLEVKSSAYADDWGPSGSDEIPPGYRAQVLWQLDTLGLQVGHVAVLLGMGGLEFRSYVIEYDATEAAWLVEQGSLFMTSLEAGVRPDIDDHGATYEAVRAMHPDIDPTAHHELDPALWAAYCDTKYDLDAITGKHRQIKATLLDAMGDARIATMADEPVLRRQAGRNGAVSLQPVNRKAAA